jgi:putative ABC transport system ATP-binding protein
VSEADPDADARMGDRPLAIEARGLTKSYEADGERVNAVRNVTLCVAAGEYLAVTGPSGSGKSTLLHLLGGLDEPTAGEVSIGGRRLSGLSSAERADVRNRSVGFVFQFFNLLPALTVVENVALPALIAGHRHPHSEPRVPELLEMVGLADKANRYPSQLSGGEQQRVAIARALVMRPSVLLADEPTGNLDSESGDRVLALLRSCHAAGQTIVLVSHDVRVATQTQRVLFLRDGSVVDDTRLDSASERQRAVSLMVRIGDGD